MADQTLNALNVVRSNEAYALIPATCRLAKSLSASTAESFAVPSGAKFVMFEKSSGVDFYANYTTTATVPGDVTIADATASEMNPAVRSIPEGCTAISVIAAAACIVQASFFS